MKVGRAWYLPHVSGVKSREFLTMCRHAQGSEKQIEWGYKATYCMYMYPASEGILGEGGICHVPKCWTYSWLNMWTVALFVLALFWLRMPILSKYCTLRCWISRFITTRGMQYSMRPHNESVCCEQHLPGVEQTLAQLAGAQVFTKLDANLGFWQIPLSTDS